MNVDGWRMRMMGRAALLATLVAAASGAVSAQQAPATAPQTIRVTTGVVNVYAVVKDKKKHPIPGLNREDFELREDNVSRDIMYFSRETDTPLTLGILVDTSGSMQHVLGVEQQEAKAFIDQVITARDLAFVLHFDIEVELLQDLTSNHQLLARAIDSTVINTGGGGVVQGPFPSSGGGGTNLHDAVYLAARELLKNEVGRKVIIILSDGEDTGSRMRLNDALEAAQKSDVIIYSIAVIDRSYHLGRMRSFGGESTLARYADETGGRVIEVNHAGDTAQAFQEIAEELRTQYLLGFALPEGPRNGSYRKIQVNVRDRDYKVQARKGYYGPTE